MRDRLGVRGRLLFAFMGIAAFSVLAATIALYAFMAVGVSLETITRNRVPSTIASQLLSRQVERIASAAPAMLSVESAEEHEQMSRRLSVELSQIQSLLADLQDRDVDPGALNLIKLLVEQLSANLTTIDSMIFNNLVLVEQLDELRRDLGFADIAMRRLLAPGIRVVNAKLSELRRSLEAREEEAPLDLARIARLAEPVVAAAPLNALDTELSTINDGLVKAASAKSEADLNLLLVPMRRSLDAVGSLLSEIEPRFRTRLHASLTKFRVFVDDPEGIVATRARQLRHLGHMQTLLDQNVAVSQQLTKAVDDLVSRAQRDIHDANRDAFTVRKNGTIVMFVVVAMSLICSGLIVWLYVGRNLIARLTGLSDSMLAIAGGKLETPIPSGGADEISRMAAALIVFRDTAIEVRNSNLRELQEMRRRMIDAIESISEGFSLYDADDRLVICNSRYRDDLYSGIADVMVPGVPFESVIRAAAERGLIEGAEDDIEGWIEKRLARHRAPPGPHLQQQSDGRWIQISERKTDKSSTVAVYSDVTALIEHEQALAEKSNALEQLSNQLAKYLSPQVYDSIFSGKQEVKVASSRKKLTVFFSDIVGFTEAADRLESEELSQLLNHYLTEMSKIALKHGATIDKFVGDAILIFFGDPETKGEKQDALACVRMAIEMRLRLQELGQLWRDSGIEKPLQVRMGIHTGYCTVGNFGSEDRLDYTIVGGTVNTASRLETSAVPGEILISYETYAHVQDEILCEEHGEIEVKGIAYPITTYQVVDLRESLGATIRPIRTKLPHFQLEVDASSMSPEELGEALAALRDSVERLSRLNTKA
jgi:class 3 adenylate cyclase